MIDEGFLANSNTIVFFSCESNKEKPKNILSEIEMASIMVDMQIIESALERKVTVDTMYTYTTHELYGKVFQKYDVSEESFKQSFDFYRQDPAALENIFDLTIAKLSKLQAEAVKGSGK